MGPGDFNEPESDANEEREEMFYAAHPACETCSERMCDVHGEDGLEACEWACVSDLPEVAFTNSDGHRFCVTCESEARKLDAECRTCGPECHCGKDDPQAGGCPGCGGSCQTACR